MNLYGLIGYPLGHSFSKQFFNDKFVKEGLEDYFFELYPLAQINDLLPLLAVTPALKGLAVTIPYKESVIPFLTTCSEESVAIGAVNCISVVGTHLKGYNTDVIGFEQSFTKLLQPHHTKALILGTGGASKAVQYVLNKLQIPFFVVSRKANAVHNILAYEEVDQQIISEHTIIINCTPLGMTPDETSKPPIPYTAITDQHFLYDLVYKPAMTAFLNEGKQRQSIIKNGFEMLLLQAEENWKIWNSG
ncbi:MAG: shikimate dehydrogenase [Ferruginibacter sp.]